MLKQQQALMETEGIQMEFTDAAIREISRVAEEVCQTVFHFLSKRLFDMQGNRLEAAYRCPLQSIAASGTSCKAYICINAPDQQTFSNGCAAPALQSCLTAHPNPGCNVVPGEHIC